MKSAVLAIAIAFGGMPAFAHALSIAPAGPCIAQWPVASIRYAESGTVELLVQAGADGRVVDTRVATSSGFPRLDKATSSAVAPCRFRPPMKNGLPVTAWFRIKHAWRTGEPVAELSPPNAECIEPEWPVSSIRFGEAPAVLLAFLVDQHGKVVDSKVQASCGAKVFDNAARTALAKCHYTPPMQNGKPVTGWIKVAYTFWLD